MEDDRQRPEILVAAVLDLGGGEWWVQLFLKIVSNQIMSENK